MHYLTPAALGASARSFLEGVEHQALRHPALRHDWLRHMESGTYDDMAWALRDFAHGYSAYSAWFPRYLRAVIDKLTDDRHRAMLEDNLREECGSLGDDDHDVLAQHGIARELVDGVSHPELFRRFCATLGLTAARLAEVPEHAELWRRSLLHYLQNTTPASAVGALGFGTECVVATIYKRLLCGIRRSEVIHLERSQYVFFELHTLVDDQHHRDLLTIAADLCTDAVAREDLESGMHTALILRARFWDALHGRSMAHARAAQSHLATNAPAAHR